MFVILGVPGLLWGSGCAGGGGPLAPISGASASTRLEWDDLDAAVSYVASRNELALVDSATLREPGGAGGETAVRRYRLIDAYDHPVEIRFSTDGGALGGLREGAASRDGAVVVRFGRFGDHQREAALVEALLKRLDALAVVD
ncbi:MAG: hypothetical protein H6813_04560 [Phycisphaeraceae bacterium]|nr:hypothetical protein [Phycisphaeraceae bacterium]MCB9847221.1 hypothetical protein [Phycisphaeraceae bacterium]